MIKSLPASAGDATDESSIPELERFPGLGSGNLLQYSCLEKSVDKGAWQVTIHAVTKIRTQLDTERWC